MSVARQRVLGVVGAIAALLVAGAAVVTAPDAEQEFTSIEVHGGLGDEIRSRQLAATASAVHVADRLEASYALDPLEAESAGAWVVVDLTATWRLRASTLSGSLLRIGPRTFSASDVLPAASVIAFSANAGVPYVGPLVFEVPNAALESADAASADILLQSSSTPYPDTVPVIGVDLTAIDRVEVLDVAEAAEAQQ